MSRFTPDFNSYAQLFMRGWSEGRQTINDSTAYEKQKAEGERQAKMDKQAEEDRLREIKRQEQNDRFVLEDRAQAQRDREEQARRQRVEDAYKGYNNTFGPLQDPQAEQARAMGEADRAQEERTRNFQQQSALRGQASNILKSWRESGQSYQELVDSTDRLADPALQSEIKNLLGAGPTTKARNVAGFVKRQASLYGLDENASESLAATVAQMAEEDPNLSLGDIADIAGKFISNRRSMTEGRDSPRGMQRERLTGLMDQLQKMKDEQFKQTNNPEFFAQPPEVQNRINSNYNTRIRELESSIDATYQMLNAGGSSMSLQDQTQTSVNQLGQTVGAQPQANPFSESYGSPNPAMSGVAEPATQGAIDSMMGGAQQPGPAPQQGPVSPPSGNVAPQQNLGVPDNFLQQGKAFFHSIAGQKADPTNFLDNATNLYFGFIDEFTAVNGRPPNQEDMQDAWNTAVSLNKPDPEVPEWTRPEGGE